MLKIHVTRQFFEANGRHGDFIEKKKMLTTCLNYTYVNFLTFLLAPEIRRLLHLYDIYSEVDGVLPYVE